MLLWLRDRIADNFSLLSLFQELFWSFPDLEPLYGAFKTYLEVPQRLNVINARVDVLQDMLRLLKVSCSSRLVSQNMQTNDWRNISSPGEKSETQP